MADNEKNQDDEPFEATFCNSKNKSDTEKLNIPDMSLRRLKDVNRNKEIPAAPGLLASGEHQIGPMPDSPPITISLEPAPDEDAELTDSMTSSAVGYLNLTLPPSHSRSTNSLGLEKSYFCTIPSAE